MKRQDLFDILSTLKYCDNDFETVHNVCIFEYDGTRYHVIFDRTKDNILNFSIQAIGDMDHEDN